MNNILSLPAIVTEFWGWKNPPESIKNQWNLVLDIRSKNLTVGQICSELGLASSKQIEALISNKPQKTKTLDYLIAHVPAIRGEQDRVLANQNGYPFYGSKEIGLLNVSDQMTASAEIASSCLGFEAALVEVEGAFYQILFSKHEDLERFNQLGRAEKNQNALWKIFSGNTVQLAVGDSLQVNNLLEPFKKKHRDSDEELDTARKNWSTRGSQKAPDWEKKLNNLMELACRDEASDVSIELDTEGGKNHCFMYRVNGDRRRAPETFVRSEYDDIRNFLTNLTKATKNREQRFTEPLDGQTFLRSSVGDFYIRANFAPEGADDESSLSIALRLLPVGLSEIDLGSLNIDSELEQELSDIMKQDHGVIMVVGPTGSGKSTLIAGMIGAHRAHWGNRKKRLSVEDPIERDTPGVTQLQVNSDDPQSFNKLLRASMRQDPDLIWVGEIRDNESADLSIRMSSTGHLVATTFHANDSTSCVTSLKTRLSQDQKENFYESLLAVVAQRLVRKVCKECGTMRQPTDKEIDLLKMNASLKGINEKDVVVERLIERSHKGCDQCAEGVVGRIPVNEVLYCTAEVRSAMRADEPLERFVPKTLFHSALKLLNAGEIEISDALL